MNKRSTDTPHEQNIHIALTQSDGHNEICDILKDDFKDPKLPWNTQKMKDITCFNNKYKLLYKLTEGGQGSIYTTRIHGLKTGHIMTKVYTFHNERAKLKIIQEFMLIKQLRILCYGEIFYDNVNDKILITMDPMNISLTEAIKTKKDKNIYGLCNFNLVENNGNINLTYFILEIAGQLQRIHHRSYVHLDVKPSNIMLRNHAGEANIPAGNGWKLIDYGLCKFIPTDKIKLDHFTGTTNWEAPECKRNVSKDKPNVISTKTDIFAFGLVILYIINGYNVFRYNENRFKCRNTNDNEREYIYLNKYSKLDFDQAINQHLYWLLRDNKIDDQLYVILSQMLTYDQNDRISALEIIQQKCFEDYIYFRKRNSKYYLKKNRNRYMSPGHKRKWTNLTPPIN